MFRFTSTLIRPYWRLVLLVIAAMVVETAMSVASPWPLTIVLDSVISGRPVPGLVAAMVGSTPDRGVLLNIVVVATIVIAALQAGSAYLNSYYTVTIGQWIAHDLRQSIYAHLQRLSMSYYDRQQVGPIISTITDDVNAVQDFISTSLLDLLVDGATIVLMLVVMLSLNWKFTLIALAVAPLIAVFVYRLRALIKTAQREVRLRQSELVTIVQEGLGAIRVVKAFAGGRFERDRLDTKSRESVQAALRARRVRALQGPVVTVLIATGSAAVLWFGTREVVAGQMTAGALVVFITYISRLFRPIQDLARASTNIAQAAVGLERVRALLETDERLPRAPGAKAIEQVSGRVTFDRVSFAYVPGRLVLEDISFVAEPGQTIGLVGPSGSGKSTIVSLIPRFYDPVSGAVLMDDQDIRQFGIRSVRQQVAFVLQETQLFHAPVWQNIAYGSPDATREDIVRAAKLAQAHEFIEGLAGGYDTVVGQGGLPLSGGQRQRLGIARAIVRDAPILVLDEPTSGLDKTSERLVFEGLTQLRRGRTTFVIAHNLHTVRHADLILVLDRGRIVERGTHEDLMQQGGLYSRLYTASGQATDQGSV